MTESEQCEGTFLVTDADEESAVLKDVDTGRVHTLSSNPELARHDAVAGVVASDPPMHVTWQLIEVETRRSLSIEYSDESPTRRVRDVATDQSVGDLTREERAGIGEIHVLTVPEETTEQAVDDVLDDEEATLQRAARLGVERVEVRSAPGVVSVRYVP
jgi:hypothetical protein